MRSLALALLLPGCFGLDQYQYDDEQGVVIDSAKPETFGALVISRTSLNFGEVNVGDSATETVLLSNDGDEAISLLSIELATGDDFFINSTLVSDIGPGGEQALEIVFNPGATGSTQDALIIETDAPGAEYVEVSLAGAGADDGGGGGDDSAEPRPNVSVSPMTYSFGNVDIGDVGTLSFTIENTGGADLIVNNLVGSDATVWGWDRSFSLPAIIEPGASRSGSLTFSPNAEGQLSGTIAVQTNDPDTPEVTVNASGIGVQGCTICGPRMVVLEDSTVVSYGSELFHNILEMSFTVTIQNEGDDDLVLSNVTFTDDLNALGTSPGTFSVSGWSGRTVTLAPYQTHTLTTQFNAPMTSADSADCDGWLGDYNCIVISSNDPNYPTMKVGVSGFMVR